MNEGSVEKVREPIVEGLFYPEKAEALAQTVAAFLGACHEKPGSASAIVTPHGSYDRCGSVIAAAFKAAEQRDPEKIVLLGPVHREETDAVILPESSWFRTALGDVAVDEKSVETLLSCGTKFLKNDIPHLEEHCLEVQLPFIQHLYPQATLVPILLGKTTKANVKTLSQGLYVAFGESLKKTLFVVSTNFSDDRDPEEDGKETDAVLALAAAGNWEALIEGKMTKRFQSCGLGCLASCLALPFAERAFRVLDRKSSLPETSSDRLVEYAALTLA